MSIDRFFTTACTVTTPSPDEVDVTVDDDGVPTIASDTVDAVCHVQPYRSRRLDEFVLGREEASRARRVWFPADTELRYTSTVTISGEVFTIAGDPDSWLVGSANDHVAVIAVRQLAPATAGASS